MAKPPTSSTMAEALHTLPIFSSLSGPTVEQILKTGRIHQLRPHQRLSGLVQNADRNGEGYYFVLAGWVGIVLDHTADDKRESADKSYPNTLEFVGSFAAGDFFSDGYLDFAPSAGGVTLDCIASTAVTILRTPAPTLTTLMQQHAGWAAQLAQAMAASRRRFLSQQENTRRFVQDFFLRQGYGASRRLRVSEMSDCFDCNKCEDACANRHGHARMDRAHTHLGRLAFQQFCLNCTEQTCLASCAFDAMTVNAAGEIQINASCTGCGACARHCPYGAINMIDAPYTSADFPNPIPSSDHNGMTTLPGLFVAGDVLGPRSLKTTMQEAKRAADAMQPRGAGANDRQVLDAIIVGAGTAGLAAAQRCGERQLNTVVFEKSPTLSAKAARAATTLSIQPGIEVSHITSAGQGQLRVDVGHASYIAQNVLVCTGKPEPGRTSLLRQAGIPMIEPGTKEMANFAAARGTHAIGIKCDNCAGYPDRACIRACPTASLIELPPQELFLERSNDRGERSNFSGVAFLEGVTEQRARLKKHRTTKAILSALTLLALLVIGLECYLRRALPEYSLVGMIRAGLGDHNPVWYSSGRGYGHVLGYIGTAFMLSTLFYPLRTRCGMLKNWGAQSTWLTFHLWVGFIGATLVTYHAAFKLDRWVALACYSMWTVVLSGAIGRYLYGMVHSGIGRVEFEREALSRSAASLPVQQNLPKRTTRMLIAVEEQPGHIYTELFIMLWHELRDFSILLWLRFSGLQHITDRRTRRQTLQYLSDLAAHRRARRYLESSKRLLRYWNWAHIILTIAMFILAGFHVVYGFMYKAV